MEQACSKQRGIDPEQKSVMALVSINPRIVDLDPLRLVGIHRSMSLASDETPTLWKSFIPALNTLIGRVGDHLISLQEYPEDFFRFFQPDRRFEKWALAEIAEGASLPEKMETITIGGRYAVFTFQGTSVEFGAAVQQILMHWLPESGYELDNRPHFEWLGDRYKRNDPRSEEEIWIPIR